jgi:hypothetical protein
MRTLSTLLIPLAASACTLSEKETTQPVAQDPATLSVALTEHLENMRQHYGPQARESLPTFQATGVGGEMTRADVIALLESRGYTFTGKGEEGQLRVKVPEDRVPRGPAGGPPAVHTASPSDTTTRQVH